MFYKFKQKIKHRKLIHEIEATEEQLTAELVRMQNAMNIFVNNEGTKVFVEWLELQVELLRDKLELLSVHGKPNDTIHAGAKLEAYREIIGQISAAKEEQRLKQYEEEVNDSQPSYVKSPA